MKFSIIVPVYKVEQYLERCVQSLLHQTYHDIEIILVDDGSPDRCPQMCDDYARIDARVKVVHKVNRGLSDARNVGIRVASGDYLIFVDSDDYIELNACEQLALFTDTEYDVIIADAFVEGGSLNLTHIETKDAMTGEEYLKRAYQSECAPMAAWLNVIRRTFLMKNELFFKEGILHEDEEFTPRLLLKAHHVICSNVHFYHYVIRDDSITTKSNKKKNAEDLYNTCIELQTLYKTIQDRELRNYLLNSLVDKYLSLFNAGRIYQYGRKHYHKQFMLANAKFPRTLCKVALYYISPKLYCWVNKRVKR